jgi:hypothetical protein
MTRTFKPGPIFYQRWYRKSILIGLVLAAVVTGFLILLALTSEDYRRGVEALPIIIAAIGLGVWLYTRQQSVFWSSFRVILGEDFIQRTQDQQPPIKISRNAVAHIYEYPDQSLHVVATNPALNIRIPAGLENQAEVRAILSSWREIEPAANLKGTATTSKKGKEFLPSQADWLSFAGRNILISVVLPLIGIVIVFATNDALVLVLVGTPTLIYLIGALFIIQRSAYITEQIKRTSLAILIPLAVLILKVTLAFMTLFAR